MKFANFNILMALFSLVGANSESGTTCACDKPNIPGFTTKLRIVPKCEITTFPDVVGQTSHADQVTLSGDIVLDAVTPGAGYWREYDIILESGDILDNLVGERGSKTFDTDVVFSLANVNADQKGFAASISNGCFVVAVLSKQGVWEVVGNDVSPATVQSIALKRGAAATDTNEGAYVIRANTGLPAYTYTGVFNLTPNP